MRCKGCNRPHTGIRINPNTNDIDELCTVCRYAAEDDIFEPNYLLADAFTGVTSVKADSDDIVPAHSRIYRNTAFV